MTLIKHGTAAVPEALAEMMASMPKAAIAFSGGVDSSYLLYAARSCDMDVRAYYVNSQFQPQFELDDAKRLAQEVGVELVVIPLDVLADATVKSNPADRCYHCKQLIFTAILERAASDGYTTLMDGSNASDDAGDRPGMRALRELKVLSPLRQAGLTKDQVRACSREAGLFTWDKPAYACLATRVPTGTMLTADALEKIEKSEEALSRMGFVDFRVRTLGTAARLQLLAKQIPLAVEHRTELLEALSQWYDDVLLDLKPR